MHTYVFIPYSVFSKRKAADAITRCEIQRKLRAFQRNLHSQIKLQALQDPELSFAAPRPCNPCLLHLTSRESCICLDIPRPPDLPPPSTPSSPPSTPFSSFSSSSSSSSSLHFKSSLECTLPTLASTPPLLLRLQAPRTRSTLATKNLPGRFLLPSLPLQS